ncbi:hypothetical protein [Flavobacterium quisquiliarum]|uniref:CarboxypepD_reg-like domain-containing protein n=1 Tax=Flavobacterium quisquiliarum TaxID=1834436 RepID=A0ABV8W791_9FLAO|nr:hypothetical protein [Flavobacterium quisquiliarum]MBW1657248.1 hypothetical protein [Flavobacterium quisquiliarum]
MKVKLLTTISFFTYQLSISQTEKLLHGKVISNNIPLNKVEVINKTAKTSTTTNTLGEFSILVKAKDSLLFFTKDYFFTRIKVTSENIQTNNLVVKMIPKPEELEEVIIPAEIKFDPLPPDPETVAEIDRDKRAKDLKHYIPQYNDGSITNGMQTSFKFSLGKSREKDEPESAFKKLIRKTCSKDFFTKNLKIAAEQKELFIDFCDADPKSKSITANPNILTTIEFLTAKNEEFKKLK